MKPPNPKPEGILATICGAAIIAILICYLIPDRAQCDTNVVFGMSIIGPAGVIYGVALLILPTEKLYQTEEIVQDGIKTVVYKGKEFSALTWAIKGAALFVGLMISVALRFLWF
jgi:hypothetical protein